MSAADQTPSLLLVHAHPDDESIFTGATMARYTAQGARVTLVTCTMGERGDNRLAPGPVENGDELARVRAKELAAACAVLGVSDHRFLGGPGRWRDSGVGRTSGAGAGSFRRADVDEAASELAKVLCEVRAQVIVTYGADGLSGHPDHVRAHEVAWRAYQMAGATRPAKFYAVTIPRSVLADTIRQTPWSAGRPRPPADKLKFGLPDDQVTTEIDATAYLDAKLAALAAHATQIVVEGRFFHASGLPGSQVLGTEYYQLLAGPGMPQPASLVRRREDDLFCGL